MIKFFRRIRQKLLSEKNFSKYLLYAIGEIVLVVIGILIALQVNNWNEGRISRDYEKQLLFQLKNDLERNAGDLKVNIALLEKSLNSNSVLLTHIDNRLPYHDSLNLHFSNTGIWTKFIVNAGAYKTIESKGLDLISDLELRELVFRIYEGNLNWLQQVESIIIDQVEDFRVDEASAFFKEWNGIELIDGDYADGNSELLAYDEILQKGNAYSYYLRSVKNQIEILLDVSKGYLDDNQQGIKLIDDILKPINND